MMLAWGAGDLAVRWRAGRISLTLGAVLLLGACIAGTRLQLKYWQNTSALFTRALEVAPRNPVAHHALGASLAGQGDVAAALEHYLAALEIDPAYDAVHVNVGCILAEQGKPEEAKAHFQGVLERNPRHARARRCLGNALFAEGSFAEAVSQYELAWQLEPDAGVTAESLALVSPRQEVSPAALPYLRQALDLLPTAEARAQVASAWAAQGKFPAAIQAYRAALALQPQSPDLLNNLAWLLATCPAANLRDGAEAVRLAELACNLTRFRRTVMVGTLAAAYAEAGRFTEAVTTAQQACALAAESQDEALASKNQELLEFYRQGRPYHEAPKPAPPAPASSQP
jgi:tetratricopeptide (TPR) repeat protein